MTEMDIVWHTIDRYAFMLCFAVLGVVYAVAMSFVFARIVDKHTAALMDLNERLEALEGKKEDDTDTLQD